MKSTTISSYGWRKVVEDSNSIYSNNVVSQKKSPTTTTRAKSSIAMSEPQDKAKNMQFMDELN